MKNNYKVNGDITIVYIKRKNGDILEALIDTEDLEKVMSDKGTWFAQWNNYTKSFYVCKRKHRNKYDNEPPKRLFLHRIVTRCQDNMEPDHINHNTLDNRKENLKICTHSENMKNRTIKCKIDRASKKVYELDGTIYWHKTKKYWVGRIIYNGKAAFQKCSKDINLVTKCMEDFKTKILQQDNSKTI
jgi:hypothetical protein